MTGPKPRRRPAKLPRGVWVLGFVSLFMDTSSELIHAVLPLFLVAGLGLPVLSLGLIEGVADATAQITKVFSGALSDRLGKRKALAVFGYGLAAATKPLFPLAQGAGLVLFARFTDRLGKGIRGAPRDALIADITAHHLRGAAYGLRQALDSVGGVAGPLLAAGLLALMADGYRAVMWVAVIPAVISVTLLVRGIEEAPVPKVEGPRPRLFSRKDLAAMGAPFWAVTGVFALLLIPRFSEAFLLLRASERGLADPYVPLIFVVMNVVYALGAYPAGIVSDLLSRRYVVFAGFLLLAFAHVLLAAAPTPLTVFVGAGLWGLHLALTQGVFAALIADVAPAVRRGTGFGIFNFATGIALFIGSLGAGFVWDVYGPAAPFALAAALTVIGLIVFPALPLRRQSK